MGRHPSRWPWLVSTVTALGVLGPGLAPGYLLVRDMVAVPDPSLTPRLLGLGHEAPRVVPSDLVVALAAQVLPGDMVQKLVLLAILVGAGVGAARLAPGGAFAGSATALAAVWNPFVGERLAMGQWALLVGYAALPWVVRGVGRAASGGRGGSVLVLGLVVGSLGGATAWLVLALGVIGAGVGMALAQRAARPVLRALAPWSVLVALLALPWAVPGLLRPSATTSSAAGFDVFAPRADTPGGHVLSLLTGGGVWNAEVVPGGRDTVVGLLGAVALLCWAVVGFVLTRGSRARSLDEGAATCRPAVLGAGAVGLGVALVSTVTVVVAPLAALPGGGLLRDGHRELGSWVLVVAVGAGWAVAWLRTLEMPRVLAVLAALLPVAALPALGWGLAGLLHPVEYPPDVLAARRTLDADPSHGAVVVLPFETYRSYPWNGARPSLTPWPRLLEGRVVVSSDLVVVTAGGLATVAGEDGYASSVRQALSAPDAAGALRELGVGWVVNDVAGTAVPKGATDVVQGATASVYRLPSPVATRVPDRFDPPAGPVLAADLLCLAGIATALRFGLRRGTQPEVAAVPPTIR